ncbi:L-aminoadipate-semialdehyde dehydrogenase-phosphopantetheinyl transferase [Phytophthora nicotianae]|uniref:L-aminoadipate-semialdehyde dehydrogenase-phosphopantetheinyl transferase n=1 Tax=Phytophthora nicotianae TaxID=4792 RepID=A0A0W8DK43_PHYNI|nr:L-aminoadipate-semialdehyde dehydrogenase-phosphopantetheinyl transferase [Phytophthora nicotianae]
MARNQVSRRPRRRDRWTASAEAKRAEAEAAAQASSQKEIGMLPRLLKISNINELEYAKGFIYANVWYQPYILKIDPETGGIVTMFDLSKLVADAGVDVSSGAVLNGIAYDEAEDAFYVTGKLWGYVYKVRLIDPVQ